MSLFKSVSTSIANDLKKVLKITKPFSIDAIESQIEVLVSKQRAKDIVKKAVVDEILKQQAVVRQQIKNGLLGTPTNYRDAETMFDRITKIKMATSRGALSADNWIRTHHAGDWYAYKAGLMRFNTTRDGSKNYNIEVHRRTDKPEDSRVSFEMGRISSRDGKFRSGLASVRRQSYDIYHNSDGGFKDSAFHDNFEALKSDLERERVRQPHRNAREVLFARAASKGHKIVLSHGGGNISHSRIPYYKTGTLARTLSNTFSISSVEFKNHDKLKSQFNYKVNYKLNVTDMPVDIFEAYKYSKREYKQIVFEGTSHIAEEYIKRVIKSRFP